MIVLALLGALIGTIIDPLRLIITYVFCKKIKSDLAYYSLTPFFSSIPIILYQNEVILNHNGILLLIYFIGGLIHASLVRFILNKRLSKKCSQNEELIN